jgi:hypothetical protein
MPQESIQPRRWQFRGEAGSGAQGPPQNLRFASDAGFLGKNDENELTILLDAPKTTVRVFLALGELLEQNASFELGNRRKAT